MLSEFIKKSVYCLKCRCVRPAWWTLYQEALSHETLSTDALADFNFKARRAILKFAYENSPYYHDLYKSAGLEPEDVRSEADWIRVPMLTREALRGNFDSLCIRGLRERGRYKTILTGGSTGMPTKLAKDDDFSSMAIGWRGLSWAGLPMGQNQATVMRAHPQGFKGMIRSWFAHFPSSNIFLDASEMTEDSMQEFVRKWIRHPPMSVTAYAGGLHELALYCKRNGVCLPSPRAIFTTASPIDAIQRRSLHETFGAPVFDSYVATEANPMAGQCRCLAESDSAALHIHSDYRHIEFVDEKGLPMPVGEEGDILVTDLGDRAFPIVRYRLGDRGRALPGKCACGRPYPLMDAVRGRMGYKIYLEHGVLTGGWTVLFEKFPNAVNGFQVHQFADKSVTLSVILNREYANARREVEIVANQMREKLGAIPLRIDEVECIPHDRGKLKYIICDVKE